MHWRGIHQVRKLRKTPCIDRSSDEDRKPGDGNTKTVREDNENNKGEGFTVSTLIRQGMAQKDKEMPWTMRGKILTVSKY
jgi:hypothetical protein